MLRRKLHESLTVRIFLITLLILLGAKVMAPAPLLFLFKSNPLRRASIWILIQTDSHCIFF